MATPRAITIIEYDGKVTYYPDFFPNLESRHFLIELERELDWHQPDVLLFGRKMRVPRKVAWHGDPGIQYSYSGVRHASQGWTPVLQTLRANLEEFLDIKLNGVLANFYRTGADSMGWHRDNEPELGAEPIIPSLSFGGPRRFLFRHRITREKIELQLASGSLLLMQGQLQTFWEHSLPKTKTPCLPRINLTFRQLVSNLGDVSARVQ